MSVDLKPLRIVIRGEHDMGKSTMAALFKLFLEEHGYRHVKVADIEPLPSEQKSPFPDRFSRNRERPVHISIELVDEAGLIVEQGRLPGF